MAICYFVEDIDNIKFQRRSVTSWIKECIRHYNKKVGTINYIFCSDEYLKNINIQYLQHDYYTDIITFNNNENHILSGDIYISVDRVKENAQNFNVEFFNELLRVLIHGILHLIGFDDKTTKENEEMHKMEEIWISKYLPQ